MSSSLLPAALRLVLAAGLALACLHADALASRSVTHYIADGFDYPVGKPDAAGYYKARGFYPNGHLGEDWNGRRGGDTDYGDPIYSIGHGVVVYSDDFKMGWGNVIIIRHAYREKNGQISYVDSLYGHLQRRMVRLGEKVTRGQQVGTMGKGPRGMYSAHLHFEIRKNLAVGMHRSDYKRDYSTYHSPTYFIEKFRRQRPEYRQVSIPVDTFKKSNPNLLTMDRLHVPDVPEPGSEEEPASRPEVPPVVKDVIETQVSASPVLAEPEAKKAFWDKLLGFLGRDRSRASR